MDPLWLFELPVFTFQPDDIGTLNDTLRTLMVRERAEAPGVVRSNRGPSWHSAPDVAQRPHPSMRRLTRLIVDHVAFCTDTLAASKGVELPRHRWGIHGWATVLEQGGYMLPHDHAGADWSAIWYVDVGDADPQSESGCLVFMDRRPAVGIIAQALFAESYVMRPQNGMLVVFPASLQHYVHPYQGSAPRICLSFNLTMEREGRRGIR